MVLFVKFVALKKKTRKNLRALNGEDKKAQVKFIQYVVTKYLFKFFTAYFFVVFMRFGVDEKL